MYVHPYLHRYTKVHTIIFFSFYLCINRYYSYKNVNTCTHLNMHTHLLLKYKYYTHTHTLLQETLLLVALCGCFIKCLFAHGTSVPQTRFIDSCKSRQK